MKLTVFLFMLNTIILSAQSLVTWKEGNIICTSSDIPSYIIKTNVAAKYMNILIKENNINDIPFLINVVYSSDKEDPLLCYFNDDYSTLNVVVKDLTTVDDNLMLVYYFVRYNASDKKKKKWYSKDIASIKLEVEQSIFDVGEECINILKLNDAIGLFYEKGTFFLGKKHEKKRILVLNDVFQVLSLKSNLFVIFESSTEMYVVTDNKEPVTRKVRLEFEEGTYSYTCWAKSESNDNILLKANKHDYKNTDHHTTLFFVDTSMNNAVKMTMEETTARKINKGFSLPKSPTR